MDAKAIDYCIDLVQNDVIPQALANSKRISTIGLPLFLSLEDAVIACEEWRDKQNA